MLERLLGILFTALFIIPLRIPLEILFGGLFMILFGILFGVTILFEVMIVLEKKRMNMNLENKLVSEIMHAACNSVYPLQSSVWYSVRGYVWDSVKGSVEIPVRDSVYSSVWNFVSHKINGYEFNK
jgi:hypothetical protein